MNETKKEGCGAAIIMYITAIPVVLLRAFTIQTLWNEFVWRTFEYLPRLAFWTVVGILALHTAIRGYQPPKKDEELTARKAIGQLLGGVIICGLALLIGWIAHIAA